MPALLAQTGVVVAIVRATVYFIYKSQPQEEYTPPEPCAGKAIKGYSDESKFTNAMLLWDDARVIHDQSEELRIAELHKHVRRMGSLSALTCVLFMFISPRIVGNPLNIFVDITAVILGWIMVFLATVIEILFKQWRHRNDFYPLPFDEPVPWYADPPPTPRKQSLPSPDKIQVTTLRDAYEILGLQPGRTTLSEAKAAYRLRMAEYHPDKVAHLGKELRDLAARKALEINLAMQFIESNRR
jgi:hypothetical protein